MELELTKKDLAAVINDAANRGRKSVYFPSSLYSESSLSVASELYGSVYEISRVFGAMDGILINLDKQQ